MHTEVSKNIAMYAYYYTPLPLNLANNNNKQQATSNKQQQAHLHAVLAIAPSQRIGSFAHVAILEPRWWPCEIQVLSQKRTGGGPGHGRQVGTCPPKCAQFWAKNSHFSPKIAPKPGRNTQTKGNSGYTTHAGVSKSPLVPFNSTICPRNGPKRRQKAPKSAPCALTPRNQAWAVSWAMWLKIRIPRAPSPPATPHFLWFPTLRIAQRAT